MSHNGIRARSIAGKKKSLAKQPDPQEADWDWNDVGIIILAVLAVIGVVAAVCGVIALSFANAERSGQHAPGVTKLSSAGSNISTDFITYGVHLDSTDKIDRVISREQIDKMTERQRKDSNVLLFFDGNDATGRASLLIPSTVVIDGTSHSADVATSVVIQSRKVAISTYNGIVDKQHGITLRGTKGAISLQQSVAAIIANKITMAAKSGQQIVPPVVKFDGKSTVIRDDAVATAYKAGLDASSFVPKCPTSSEGTPPGTCTEPKASYNFGCQTIGVTYPDWAGVAAQIRSVAGLPDLIVRDPSSNQLTLTETEPCGINTDASPSISMRFTDPATVKSVSVG